MSSVSQFPPPHLIPNDDDQEQKTDSITDTNPILALPAPSDATASSLSLDETSNAQDAKVVKLDHLGPMIVSNKDPCLCKLSCGHISDEVVIYTLSHQINTDGTISRVHNWDTLTASERDRTYRLIVQRNKARIEKLKAQEEKLEVIKKD